MRMTSRTIEWRSLGIDEDQDSAERTVMTTGALVLDA
jgi:hypothetical protein